LAKCKDLIKQQKEQLIELTSEKESLSAQKRDDTIKLNSLEVECSSLRSKLAEQESRLNSSLKHSTELQTANDKLHKRCSDLSSELDEKANLFQRQFQMFQSEYNDKESEFQRLVGHLKGEITRLQQENAGQLHEIGTLKSHLDELNDKLKQQEYEHYQSELEMNERKLVQLENELRLKLDENLLLVEESKRLNEQLDESRQILGSIESKLNNESSSNHEPENNLSNKLDSILASYKAKTNSDQLDDEISSLREENSKLKLNLSELENKKNNLEEKNALEKQIEELQNRLDEAVKQKQQLNENIESIKKELNDSLEENESKSKALQSKSEESDQLKTKVAELELLATNQQESAIKSIDSLNKQLNEAIVDHQKSKAQITSLSNELEETKRALNESEATLSKQNATGSSERENLLAEIDSLKEENKQLKEKLRESEKYANEASQEKIKYIEALNVELEKASKSNQKLNEELTELKNSIMILQNQHQDLSTALKEANDAKKKVEKTFKQLEDSHSQSETSFGSMLNAKLAEANATYETQMKLLEDEFNSRVKSERDEKGLLNEKLDELSIELISLREKNAKNEKEVIELRSQLEKSKIDTAEQEARIIEEIRSEEEKQRAELIASRELLEKKLNDLTIEIENFKQQIELNEIIKRNLEENLESYKSGETENTVKLVEIQTKCAEKIRECGKCYFLNN
jgi:chromosome segregation ATPase